VRKWRLITPEDQPWAHYLIKKRYGEKYTYVEAEGWAINTVLKNSIAFFAPRTDNALLIAHFHAWPWTANEFCVDVMFICADDGAMWEAMELIRASIDWAKSRKAARWRISSETDYDITPLARRVGATKIAPRCELEL
jgi:hypothetical protein